MEKAEREFIENRINKDMNALREIEEQEQYQRCAKQLRTAYKSFVDEGFTEEQAFWFVAQIVKKAFKNS